MLPWPYLPAAQVLGRISGRDISHEEVRPLAVGEEEAQEGLAGEAYNPRRHQKP
jgi:hypothetical protein